MSFTTAKEGKHLHVYTSIGNKSYHFKCRTIEETDGGFILSDIENHEEDNVLINNAPVIIAHGLLERGRGAELV